MMCRFIRPDGSTSAVHERATEALMAAVAEAYGAQPWGAACSLWLKKMKGSGWQLRSESEPPT